MRDEGNAGGRDEKGPLRIFASGSLVSFSGGTGGLGGWFCPPFSASHHGPDRNGLAHQCGDGKTVQRIRHG